MLYLIFYLKMDHILWVIIFYCLKTKFKVTEMAQDTETELEFANPPA